MPLVGEQAGSTRAIGPDNNVHSVSWDLDFPVGRKFIKLALGGQWEYGHRYSGVDIGLLRIRRQPPNAPQETVNFPNPSSFASVLDQFDPRMTHVRFGMRVKRGVGTLVWSLGHWG